MFFVTLTITVTQTMSMTRWLGILVAIIFAVVSPVSVCTNVALNITRGNTDKFTNPRCVGSCAKSCMPDSINCDCPNGAYCVTPNCSECQCDATNPTFYHIGYSDGKCVENEKISVSLGKYILKK
jgi:hypothetical protein